MESALRRPGLAFATASDSRMSGMTGAVAACLLLTLAIAATSLPVHAEQSGLLQQRLIDPASVAPRATPAPRLREPRLSPSDAARQVQRRYGGRVLSVQAHGGGGFRIKVLKDGEVRTYDINP